MSSSLYWLPLGAGGWFVRLNGRVYETIKARRDAGCTTQTEVRATVVLGTGKRVTSRKGVRIRA